MRSLFLLFNTLVIGCIFLFSFGGSLYAQSGFSGDIMLPQNHVRFSQDSFMEGQTIRVYVTAVNNGTRDLLGAVRLMSNGVQVGSDQPISVLLDRTDSIFIDWTLNSPGKKNVKVMIIPWDSGDDDPSNNIVERSITVVADTDRDGIPNVSDSDDDNDGVSDENDAFPTDSSETVDTDGDKIGDNKDVDDDNDGVEDGEDVFPLDGDESNDFDEDGIGDNADEDDDNDGLNDDEENVLGTDKLNKDSDNDGVEDGEDAFPLDEGESEDFDGDGVGDNADEDDDNDGIVDVDDFDSKNKGPVLSPDSIELKGKVGGRLVLLLPEISDEDGGIVRLEVVDEGKNEILDSFDGGELVDNGDGELETDVVLGDVGDYVYFLKVYDDKGEFRFAEFRVSVFESNIMVWLLVSIFVLLLAMAIALKYLRKAENQN